MKSTNRNQTCRCEVASSLFCLSDSELNATLFLVLKTGRLIKGCNELLRHASWSALHILRQRNMLF